MMHYCLLFRTLFLSALLLILVACSSSPRKLHYYALTPNDATDAVVQNSFTDAIGIGPVTLPEMHSTDGVLYWGEGSAVVISEEHLWAGDLKRGIARTLAQGLAQRLNMQNVFSFPWDSRMRPDRQVFVVVEQFSGPLNGEVVLQATWSHYDVREKRVLFVRSERFVQSPEQRTVAEYVGVLNQLMVQLTEAMTEDFSHHPP